MTAGPIQTYIYSPGSIRKKSLRKAGFSIGFRPLFSFTPEERKNVRPPPFLCSPAQPCHCGWTSKRGPDVGPSRPNGKLLGPPPPIFGGEENGYKHTMDGKTILHQLMTIGNMVQHWDHNWHFFHLPCSWFGGFPKWWGTPKSSKIGCHQLGKSMVWGTHILGNLHFLTIHYATPSGTPQKRSSSEGSSRHPMPRGIHIDIHIDAAFVFVL